MCALCDKQFSRLSKKRKRGKDPDLPFSPVSRLRCSSASERILPAPRTSHGARAIPNRDEKFRGGRQGINSILTLFDGHGKNITLEIPEENTPCTLVDDEGGLASKTSISVGLGDDPCWSVGDSLLY